MLTCVNAADTAQENSTLLDQSDLLGGTYYDDDFYISVEENYAQDKDSWDSNYIVYISSQSQSNGTFSILVNDTEKLSIPLTDGYFSCEDDGYGGSYNRYYEYIYPTNLSLDCGNYNIKVNFNGDTLIDNDVLLKEKDDFDIYLFNIYYCDEDYWDAPSFIIIDSNHANTGTLEVLVNGTKKIAYNVTNGNFDYIPDCRNVSRYIAPSDILDDYGTYNIKITFTENDMTKVLKDEIVSVIGPEPTTDPKLEMTFYFDIQYLRADNVAYIYLPREATGNLTISYNNHKFDVPYSKGYAVHEIKAWNVQYLGETVITATYVGDDFGTLTTNGTIIVTPGVKIPYYASLGEEFTISMTTHDWVNGGKFDVYDYTGDVKGELIASNEINWGVSSVSVSSDTLGLNKFYLEYDTLGSGKYYSIQEINIIENSENVLVDVPSEVPAGEAFNITINSPAHDFNFVSISVDGNDPEFYPIYDGNLTKTISGSSRGYHKIVVQYDNRYYEDGKWVGDVYSNTFNVNAYADIKFDAPELTKDYKGTERFVATVTDGNNYTIQYFDVKVIVNNQTYVKTTDYMGRVYLDANFDAGVYPVTLTDDHSYATSKITINKLNTNTDLSFIKTGDKNVTLTAIVSPSAASGNVTFCVNGDNYTSTINGSKAILDLSDLNGGNYTVNAIYDGEINYNSSLSNTVEFYIEEYFIVVSAPDVTKVYGDLDKFVVNVCDNKNNPIVNGEVRIAFNNNTYIRNTDNDGNASVDIDLDSGVYDVVTQYEDIEVNSKITVNKADTNITLRIDSVISYNFMLAADVNPYYLEGNVIFSVNGKNYTSSIGNSEATLYLKELSGGIYVIQAFYEGDVNYKPSSSNVVEFKIDDYSIVVLAPNVTKNYGDSDNFIVTVCDDNGYPISYTEVNITFDGETHKMMTDVFGKAYYILDCDCGVYDVVTQYNDIVVYSKVIINKLDTNATLSYEKINDDAVSLIVGIDPIIEGGDVIFSVNNKNYTATTTPTSEAVLLLLDLEDGNYTVVVYFDGDANHNPCISNEVQFDVDTSSVVVSAPDVTKYYNGPERFVVTVCDKNNNPIANATVNITINGKKYSRTTNENGMASMAINLNSGIHDVVTQYGDIEVKSTVTVKSTVSGENVTKIYRNQTQYYATFVDTKGNLLTNTPVKFNINGVYYSRTTNASGVAKININLNPGTYIITAENPNSTELYSNIINVLPSIVENHDLTKYYKNDSQYIVKILGDDGKAVGAGITVTFNINGVLYNRTTNASGHAKLNINLNPAKYIVTVEYNGLRVSNTITVKSILEAKDLKMKYRDGSKFEAKLVDGKGNPFAGQTIKFNINGVFYNRNTDANGIARLNINLMAGQYIITSMYNNGATISNKVTISS
jgi:hypothetical protein